MIRRQLFIPIFEQAPSAEVTPHYYYGEEEGGQ